MAIDGLIILDNAGRSIIQSGFRSTSPAYPLLHIDAVSNALAAANKPLDVDPVLPVPHPNNSDIPSACCHIACGDLRILCTISGNVDPLQGFSFLQTFIDILQEYFGGVSLAIVKENFDVVYQLLEETLDSGGHPLTTSHNALRDIVLPPSLFSKLLTAASANLAAIGGASTTHGLPVGPFSSPIPWRKAGVKYASNEMYVDVTENLHGIVNKHGVPLISSVCGKIDVACRLSGTPECILTLTNPQVMTDPSFHPCVRLQRWMKERAMTFIPPDGHFVLSEYRYTPGHNSSSALRFANPSSSAGGSLAPAKEAVPIPFSIKVKFEIEDTTASFSLTFSSRLTTRPVENVSVELNLGNGAHAIKCTASRESGGLGRGLSALEAGMSASTAASWAFDSRKKVLRWEIPNVPPSTHWSLQGSFSASTTPPRPSHAVQIRFEIQSHTFSAIKVDQLKITGEGYKPYKGVRGRSTGNVEWRW